MRVVKSDTRQHVLAWRPGGAIDRIPVWDEGVYAVTVGSRVFGNLKSVARRSI